MRGDVNFESILTRLNGMECSLSKFQKEIEKQIEEIKSIGSDFDLDEYLADASIALDTTHIKLRKAREYVEHHQKIKEEHYVFTLNGIPIRYRAVKDLPDGCIVVFRSMDWKYLGNLPIRKDDERFPNPDSLEESVRIAAEMGLLPELAKECNIAETKTGGE